jgi:uncharacterized protein
MDDFPEAPRSESPRGLDRLWAWIIAHRWLVIAIYAVLLPPAAYYALGVGQDNSIERLVVTTDPDYLETRRFQQAFGSGEYAVLVLEAEDPLAPEVLGRLGRMEAELSKVPKVYASSVLTAFRRVRAGFDPGDRAAVDEFGRFATKTSLFRRQGLIGDHFLTLPLALDVQSHVERDELLARIDAAVERAGGGGPPLRGIRKVGQPYVTTYLGRATRDSAARGAVLFVALAVGLLVFLYRSWRTLLAFAIALGACLALSVGYVGFTRGTFTIVSPMVPMSILITATSSLVYLHSRFVERPAGTSVIRHQIFALSNKFVAVTASLFATAVGFAALGVSNIRPIRELGIWVAVGLVCTWVVVFTLFPALQAVLRTPTVQERRTAAPWFARVVDWVPRASYRWRWPLVAGAVCLTLGGAVALFGLPGLLPPARMHASPEDYMNRRSHAYQDLERSRAALPGLSITQVWLRGRVGCVSEPEVLTGLYRFQRALESERDVGSVVGVPTVLRVMRYLGGQGDGWPSDDPEALEDLAADLEQMAKNEPSLRRFVGDSSLSQTYLAVVTPGSDTASLGRVEAEIRRHWQEISRQSPALSALDLRIVGQSRLQAKVEDNLVPTLVNSFAITVGIILAAFVLVFRSGLARVMALIPSLFSIMVMFGVMRLGGVALNVATILIASTILGASENDQIHFFYHFLEKRRSDSVHASLRHALLIAGRPIFFASIINAGGFLAFASADLPPIREFGILASTALAVAALANFTVLPAALWILLGAKPEDPSGT